MLVAEPPAFRDVPFKQLAALGGGLGRGDPVHVLLGANRGQGVIEGLVNS